MRTRGIGTRVATAVAVIALVFMVVGCSGSSSDSSNANPASCPFSGQTTPSNGPATGGATPALTNVSTRADGCIDNIQFDFSGGTPAWSISYQPGPFKNQSGAPVTVAGKEFLVVELQGVTSNVGAGAVKGLNNVQGVQEATSASGADQWIIGLNSKLQYTTSPSATPAYLVVGIG